MNIEDMIAAKVRMIQMDATAQTCAIMLVGIVLVVVSVWRLRAGDDWTDAPLILWFFGGGAILLGCLLAGNGLNAHHTAGLKARADAANYQLVELLKP